LDAFKGFLEFAQVSVSGIGLLRNLDDGRALFSGSNGTEIQVAEVHRIFEIVDRVGDVVAKVHDLRFETALLAQRALANPVECRTIVVIHPKFADSVTT
jgi:hypothetical protein